MKLFKKIKFFFTIYSPSVLIVSKGYIEKNRIGFVDAIEKCNRETRIIIVD